MYWSGRRCGLALAEAVFGGDGAAERDGVGGELFEELGCDGSLGFGGGEHVDVEVSVADVAEDDVVTRKFCVEALAVEVEHGLIFIDRDGVVGAHVHEAAAAHSFDDEFGEGMAEYAEALPVFGADGKPGGVDESAGLFEPGFPCFYVVAVGFDQECGGGVEGDLGVANADHVEGVAIGIFDHVERGDATPCGYGGEGIFV